MGLEGIEEKEKVDITPPKDLHVPVIPDRTKEGKLLFHLHEIKESEYTSVELKYALSLGYKITKIYSAIEYLKYNGLMKNM